ncbi:uncharacterized protein LOC135665718 [Musa acuminata AAA Group]|uniref:uncharacterized protein LOC135665718 n=1 Tax=Musa acuminata AAA Group TaxID=214697 RepID=UPI0031CDDDBD
MAEIVTVIIKVDLQCCTCSRKIKKALCELQKWFNIQSIVFDEKKNTVTVSGPFNPDCFIKELLCLACKVIKGVHIKEPAKPPPPPPPPPPVCVCPPPVCVCPPPVCVCPPHVCVCRPPVWPVCCKQPCPCFDPRQGCRRCCTCGWICDVPSLPPWRPNPVPLPEAVVRPPMCGFPPTGWPVCCKQPCPCVDPRQGCRRCCTCGWICDVPSPPPCRPFPEAGVRPPVCVFPPQGWPNCCRQPCPCFEPRSGCRRCCSCGWVCDDPSPSAACRPGCEVGGCKIIVGQEPYQSCSIM